MSFVFVFCISVIYLSYFMLQNAGGQRISGDYNGFINNSVAPPPAPPPMSNRGGRGGDNSFRYF